MLLRVKYFARFREIVDREEEEIEITPGSTVLDLKRIILQLHPGMSSYEKFLLVACNDQFAADDRKFAPDDIVSIFPPVSGG
jgi:molybdopterin synthase sulfur carrier subunit